MKDRIPTYPGRVTLIPVEGQANTFTMTMADSPIVEGTPPTKANLLSDETASFLGLDIETATVDKALRTALPKGCIVMWSGAVAKIPTGWALCDGQNGTPDLLGRFVVAAGGTYSVGQTGGADSVVLSEAQMPSHTHTMELAGEHTHVIEFAAAGSNPTYLAPDNGSNYTGSELTANAAGEHTHTVNKTGSGTAHENRPPFYALCYIMKI